MRFTVRAAKWMIAGAGAVACSDSPAGPDVTGTPLTVWVLEERLTLGGDDKPLANVRVAFDVPGGERVSKTTEADGHVTFRGDFSQGGASVTVLSDNHIFVTMLEASPETARAQPNAIGKPAEDLVIFPPRLDGVTESVTVGLRGNLIGKRSPDHVVALASSSLLDLGAVRSADPTFIVRGPRDRAFFLLGHEIKVSFDPSGLASQELIKSFRVDLSARTDDLLLDLDLAKLPSLPTRTVHVRAEAPESGPSPFGVGTRAVASVASVDSELALGLLAKSTASADNRSFELEVALVDTDVGPERTFTRVVLTAADGSQSVRSELGPLTEGAVWKEFPLPPSIASPDAARSVRGEIPLDGFPVGADLLAEVHAGGSLLWILYGPPGGPRAKSFTVPYRDEVGELFVQSFALSLSARKERVALPGPARGRGDFYRYTSTFRDILLRKR